MPPAGGGVSAEVVHLAAAHAANADAMAANRAALRAERQRLKRARKRDEVQDPHVSPGLWAVLMLLFYFTGYDAAAPAEYWQLRRRSQLLSPLPADALNEKVEALFLDVPPAELIELADPEGEPQYFLGRPLKDSAAFARLSSLTSDMVIVLFGEYQCENVKRIMTIS